MSGILNKRNVLVGWVGRMAGKRSHRWYGRRRNALLVAGASSVAALVAGAASVAGWHRRSSAAR
jgi:hypothetical protein